MNRTPLFAVVLLCGCAGPGPGDAQRLLGDWVVVDFHSPAVAEDRGQLSKRATITEGTWSEQFQGARYEDFEYAVDTGKCPKELDLIFTGPDGKRLRVRAIYEFLDDDRLRVCFGTPPIVPGKNGEPEFVESVRPTAFEPTGGPLVRYQRRAAPRPSWVGYPFGR